MVRQVNQSNLFDDADNALPQRKRSRKTYLPTGAQAAPDRPVNPHFSELEPAQDTAKLKHRALSQVAVKALQRNWLDRYRQWRWQIVWIGTLSVFGGISLLAYSWLANLPPLPDCRNVMLSSDAQRLYCAQEIARSGDSKDLIVGIRLVKDWSPNHPLYRDGQRSLTKWSKQLIQVARDKMRQSDFKGAMEAIKQIPQSSPVYPDAQELAGEWQKQWQAGETLYARAVEAMKLQDWRTAFDQVTELGYLDHDYWRLQQADGLAKQILMQKESYEALKQAKKLAKKLTPEQLGEAIALLQTVSPQSNVWIEAQSLSQSWSQDLLKTALLRWQDGDTSGAIQLAQQVPLDLNLAPEAQDLVKYSHAYQLVSESQIEAKLSWRQLWGLLEATNALKQIQPESPIYAEAAAKLQDWQAQLQDLQKLQIANVIADLGQKPALEYAITKAQQLTPDRQRYSQAQTMIGNWQHQIEQIEDMPYLWRAQQFASTNLVPDIQLAIAQAQVIPPQRSIASEVQSQILAWQKQIERIEDQPILDQANKLAKANKLDEAIAKAAEIRLNRALYDSAQTAITSWKEKIRAIEMAKDQEIMDQARGFAGSGQLTDAIATANQLSPGRPLYLEAQAAIGAWLRERDGNLKTEQDVPIDAGVNSIDSIATDSSATDSSETDAGTESFSEPSEAPADADLETN